MSLATKNHMEQQAMDEAVRCAKHFASEVLYPQLLEVDQAANERLAQLMPQMAKAAGITAQLKTTDQMKWVGLMNTIKAQVEESIFTKLVFS